MPNAHTNGFIFLVQSWSHRQPETGIVKRVEKSVNDASRQLFGSPESFLPVVRYDIQDLLFAGSHFKRLRVLADRPGPLLERSASLRNIFVAGWRCDVCFHGKLSILVGDAARG